jgi:hypothetical protein
MIGTEACQKGGSMRSKSLAERPPKDHEAKVRRPATHKLQTPGALSLVRGLETRPAVALKPGLY